jgi:hypothetical protein
VRPLVCSDVDGTVVDTRELNRYAYRLAGIEIPDLAWGRTWYEWLPGLVGDLREAVRIHDEKIRVYSELVDECNAGKLALPMTWVLQDATLAELDTCCLTASSLRTARTLLERLNVTSPLVASLSYERRLETLRGLLRADAPLVYVDDDERTVDRLGSDLPGINVVRYTGQTYTQLRHEVLEPLLKVTTDE